MRTRFFEVENEDGIRLDLFLCGRIARMSRTLAQRCIKSGSVRVEGRASVKANMRLRRGDVVSLSQDTKDVLPECVPIVEENEDYFVFDKPSGLLLHPTANKYFSTLSAYCEHVLGQKAYIVHRLDADTSGIVIVAKNPDTAAYFREFFDTSRVCREYTAIVRDESERWPVGHKECCRESLGFAGIFLPKITMGRGNLSAITDFECIDRYENFARLRCILRTGRQHQIRVHLKLSGTPVFGDKLYEWGEENYKNYLDGKCRYDGPPLQLQATEICLDGHIFSCPRRLDYANLFGTV